MCRWFGIWVLIAICPLFQWVVAGELSVKALLESSRYEKASEGQVTESRSKLQKAYDLAMASLEGLERIDADSVLGLTPLSEAIASPQSMAHTFQEAYQRLCTSEAVPVDTKEAAWVHLRAQLLEHSRLLRSRENELGEAQMAEHFSALLKCLPAEGKTSETSAWTPACERQVRKTYTWLYEHGQNQNLLKAIRQEWFQSNQQVFLRGRLLPKLVNREFHNVMAFDKFESGAHISGQAKVVGNATAGLAANPELAEIKVHFRGKGEADDVVTSVKRATVWSDVETDLTGYQTLVMDPSTFTLREGKLSLSASQQTAPHSSAYSPRFGIFSGRLRARIALRVAESKIPEMNAKGAEEAKKQFREKLKVEMEKMLVTANSVIAEKFSSPMKRQDLLPQMKLSSTSDYLVGEGLFAAPGFLGAPRTAVPKMSDVEADLYMKVHESAVNNSNRLFFEKEVDEATFREMFFEKMGFTTPSEDEVNQRDLAQETQLDTLAVFKLAKVQPLLVSFRDGKVSVGLQLQSFSFDGETYAVSSESSHESFRLRADYEIFPAENKMGLIAVRLGDVRVLGDRSKTAGETELAVLRSVAKRFFPKRAVSHGVTLKSESGDFGKLVTSEAVISNGWLALAWRHYPSDKEKK